MNDTFEMTEPPELQFKAAPAFAAGGAALDVKPEGIVTAIVSVTGVLDEVNDILEPGCYAETLTKRNPKVIRAHTWTEQVGRVLHIEEMMPGDSRLPRQTKDGRPWPSAAGALVATMQYNLDTERGRVAFSDVRFYSESKEAEYSIGYQVPKGGAYRDRAGVRRVRKLDLFEISDVLFGAAPLSMTLSLKDATASPAAAGDPDAVTASEPAGVIGADGATVAVTASEPDAVSVTGDLTPASTGVASAEGAGEPAAEAAGEGSAEPPQEPPAEGESDSEEDGEDAGAELSAEELARLHAEAIAGIDWDEIARAAAETAERLRTTGPPATEPEPEPAAADIAASPPYDEGGHVEPAEPMAVISAAELAEGLALLGQEPEAAGVKVFASPEAAEGLAEVKGSPGPIRNAEDLAAAITAAGKDFGARLKVIAAARRLGLVSKLPKEWKVTVKKDAGRVPGDGAADGLAWAEKHAAAVGGMIETKAGAPGVADTPGDAQAAEKLRRWYVHGEGAAKIRWNEGGDWQRCVDIAQKHMTVENARGYCALRHREATGMTTSQHAARDRAGTGKKDGEPQDLESKLLAWEPAAEIGPLAAHRPVLQVKGGTAPGGWGETAGDSLETRRERVRSAVVELLAGQADGDGRYPWDQVTLLGTWPDRVIARRETWPDGGGGVSESFEVGYLVGPEGEVELGSPRPVDVDVSVDPSFDATVLQSSVAGVLEDAGAGLKLLLGQADLEVKEGRVLSGVNLKRLRDAVTSLLAVLAAAGVEIDKPTDAQVDDERHKNDVPPEYAGATGDTTSDGARDLSVAGFGFGRKDAAPQPVISPAELAEGLALIGGLWE